MKFQVMPKQIFFPYTVGSIFDGRKHHLLMIFLLFLSYFLLYFLSSQSFSNFSLFLIHFVNIVWTPRSGFEPSRKNYHWSDSLRPIPLSYDGDAEERYVCWFIWFLFLTLALTLRKSVVYASNPSVILRKSVGHVNQRSMLLTLP